MDPTPFAERVLDLVGQVPPGRVVSYGDVADMLAEGGPRAVGRVMALWGGGVPWHRVVRADGTPAGCQAAEAVGRLRSEGVPFVGGRVDMARARWEGPPPGEGA